MYSHNMVGTNDVAKSKAFYDATFKAIGGKEGIQDDKGRLIYMHGGGLFLVTPPIDGQPATPANGGTIGRRTKRAATRPAWITSVAGTENPACSRKARINTPPAPAATA